MTRQTPSPLAHHTLRTSDRSPREIATSFHETFSLHLEPQHQHGDMWDEDQRIALIRSWLTTTPTDIVIFNDRTTPDAKAANGYDPTDRGEPMYACIDGKQRITTAYLWYDDRPAVPAADVTAAEETANDPSLRHSHLTRAARLTFANRAHLSVAIANASRLAARGAQREAR
ncbi:hypothetical protein ACH4PU_32695 [Streptomyces sp. NPDC021100]|uniref:hypothetical protein n=1 Tax=Streptomyces sp. NPDC021100 TaxID=3365114 RepID=UPI0037ADBBB0